MRRCALTSRFLGALSALPTHCQCSVPTAQVNRLLAATLKMLAWAAQRAMAGSPGRCVHTGTCTLSPRYHALCRCSFSLVLWIS